MPEDKGLGSKLLGLFVETDARGKAAPDEAEADATSPAEVVAQLAAQSAPRKGPPPAPAAPPLPPRPPLGAPADVAPAAVNFDDVFRAAGMEPADLDRVRKAEELLRSLPEATPREVKRQIVEASLKAFGFEVQKIASAAQSQLKAVDTWVALKDKETQKALADARGKIAQLEDQVISLKADINKRADQLASLGAAGQQRKAQVQQVLDFFQVPPPASPGLPKP
jgi:hypothetical protein